MDLCENALGEVESIYLLYPISATSGGDDRCACDCGNCADVIYSEALHVSTFADEEEKCCKAADIGNNKP